MNSKKKIREFVLLEKSTPRKWIRNNKLSFHIIWELPSQCDVWVSSVTLVSGFYIQTNLVVNCLPAASDRYYHTFAQKWWSGKFNFFFFVFSHPGGSVSLTGVRELGSIYRRLPDDPGEFTCMWVGYLKLFTNSISRVCKFMDLQVNLRITCNLSKWLLCCMNI